MTVQPRKSTPKFAKSPSLVLIRLVLAEKQRFKNVKINKEMYGHPVAVFGQRPDGHILTFSNGCILLTTGSIYTKLGDFVKLGPIIYRFVPSPSRFEIRQ